jgi:hypothetical protein
MDFIKVKNALDYYFRLIDFCREKEMNAIMSVYKSNVEHHTVVYIPFQNLATSIINFVKSTDR